MPNEVAERPTNALTLIQTAIERNVDPEQLGKLLDLQERYEASRAAEAFANALTAFQRECPPVYKRRAASFNGKPAYSFASFDDIMRVVGPLLAKHGIAVTFSTDPAEKGMKITCRVRAGVHCEETTLTMPIPEMKVNDTQKFGAAISYLKRYALCAALNVVVTDEDNDANAPEEAPRKEVDDVPPWKRNPPEGKTPLPPTKKVPPPAERQKAGLEILAMLERCDAFAVKEGLCKPGELSVHVRDALAVDYGAVVEDWPAGAMEPALAEAKQYGVNKRAEMEAKDSEIPF